MAEAYPWVYITTYLVPRPLAEESHRRVAMGLLTSHGSGHEYHGPTGLWPVLSIDLVVDDPGGHRDRPGPPPTLVWYCTLKPP